MNRDLLGRLVREAWVKWAKEQPDPKASWLLPYDELSEPDKEADRQIGEAVKTAVLKSVRIVGPIIRSRDPLELNFLAGHLPAILAEKAPGLVWEGELPDHLLWAKDLISGDDK